MRTEYRPQQWPSLGGGGVSAPRGVWSGGCLLQGVSQLALRQTHTPPCGQTHACKNITFATSLRTVMKRTRDFSFNNQQFKINISANHLFVLSDITIIHKKTWGDKKIRYRSSFPIWNKVDRCQRFQFFSRNYQKLGTLTNKTRSYMISKFFPQVRG